jgi:hypothetical protein
MNCKLLLNMLQTCNLLSIVVDELIDMNIVVQSTGT